MSRRQTILLAVLAPFLGACARNAPPTHFYMLRPLEGAPEPRSAIRDPVIGLGPIRIPDYLDRPQIVTALSDYEYRLSEEHRWAERLDETLGRVLAENLALLIPTQRLVFHPGSNHVDAQVSITLQALHVDAHGQVQSTARWSISQGGKAARTGRSSCRTPTSTTDYPAIVAAQSECIGEMSREIAASLRALLALDPRQR